ncbi:MAG: alpha/beta hydrolase [Deltaproteobacteria bacterium]|nr:alpha/beta hydrolase [Deltaproteobacteria bacterium]MBW2120791.1 alpha/beta hydrolase [Deltaproteobacteria bacterium]
MRGTRLQGIRARRTVNVIKFPEMVQGVKEMYVLHNRGRRIACVTGKGGMDEGRKTLVFVHGSGGSHLDWNYQRLFFQQAYNVVMVDLPGHGRAGGQGESSVEAYADHLLHVVRSLNCRVFCLFGHSLGGAIAQRFAISHGDLVQSLVLVGTGARLRVLPEILNAVEERFEEAVARISQYAFSKKAPRDLVLRGMEAMLREEPSVLLHDLKACDRFDIMDRVREIGVPALVVTGREDRLTPPKYARYLAERIEGATMEIVEGAGHMVMLEQPERFNLSASRFLEGVESGRENET